MTLSAQEPQKSEDAGPFDRFLCFAAYSTSLAFNRLYKSVLDDLGLTYPQYLVIVALLHRDRQAVSELGDALFLESNTLTPLIKRLEAAGLVTRQRDSADERVVRVSLTAQGRGLADRIACVPTDILKATGMSIEELGALQQGLMKLGDNLRASQRD
ncbi:DNA-binding MarR family transcriptional regulator [Sphingobium xanthum]|jgi:DNA-binding MarR family transcriptional regulator|uniref:MarR family winged helix-turn-helix transcriptional regulator n=1 Tax=Sphingobium xanthum TaxID=1387165 RepID=UPI001C8C1942|nr:MarR family transcriptional regulator [Sphingobium xanthum]